MLLAPSEVYYIMPAPTLQLRYRMVLNLLLAAGTEVQGHQSDEYLPQCC